MSKIAVIGSGYVGLVVGAMLSDFGHYVVCVDRDENKIDKLKRGAIPIYEPGLEDLILENANAGRLTFTVDPKGAIENNDIIFIAVGTPPQQDGSADLQYVLSVSEDIAKYINGYKVIVDKSTVPIGTGAKIKGLITNLIAQRGGGFEFDVVSNPEFLREGSAVYDSFHPDRVVIGAESDRAKKIMKEVYRVLYINETPVVETNIETAEMIKYAANAFLALKITYINEIANLCEQVGANVQQVAHAMGMDGRISPKFLHPGPGYGGSCFPKDTKALAQIARENKSPISLVEATIEANERQKFNMVKKITSAMGSVDNKTIAILGATFKPNTDDMRDAPSLVIFPELVNKGAKLKIFDPESKKEGSWRFKEILKNITFCDNEYDALNECDAIVLLTEWNQFRNLDFNRILQITQGRYFFDLRNVYDRKTLEALGFKYYGVGC